MIINLFGKVQNGYIEFEPSPVYFENGQMVNVNELFIEWSGETSNVYGCIISTLVDLCPINTKQQLVFFYQKEKSKFFHFTPTHLQKYKIQCPSMQSSLFQIELSKPEKIEKIYLQLEITNEGYKCFNQK